MDCLTERNRSGEATAICCVKGCGNDYSCIGVNRCKGIVNLIDRLADIEDIIKTDYDLSRLRELVEADREGRCVVLPCKAGNTVYAVGSSKITEAQVQEFYSGEERTEVLIEFTCDDVCDGCPFEAPVISDTEGWECVGKYGELYVSLSEFGEKIFLTREAAEAVLKERENSNV